MSEQMIEKTAVDLAIAAAQDALANETGLAWVKKSTLMERAYFMGLLFGLSAIADEGYLSKNLFKPIILGAMYARKADDTFSATTIGRDYEELKEVIYRDQTLNFDEIKQLADSLLAHIREQDRRWRYLVEEALSRLNHLTNDARDEEIYAIVQDLERCIRQISLLETDHNIWKRLDL